MAHGKLAATAVLMAAASACGSEARAEPSLVSSLKGTQPTIACIDNAANDGALAECLNAFGIPDDYRLREEPKTAPEWARHVVVSWTALSRGAGEPLSEEHFANAIEYAECVERSALTLGGLPVDGDPRNAPGAGRAKANIACANHPLSSSAMWTRYPGLRDAPLTEQKAFLLASLFSGAAYGHVVESRGWVTDAMRECVRYADGRPPSPGCAHAPARVPPVAPPPPSNR